MDTLWFGLVLVVAIGLFVLKYEVQNLEDELTAREAEIAEHAQAIHVLEAEWTFLNDPARLRDLGAEHLELGPVNPERIVPIDALPSKRTDVQSAPDSATPLGAAP